ncbi:MAG: SpoIIE family protein phosphatase, partial [Chthoniobacteraceae bacterium]
SGIGLGAIRRLANPMEIHSAVGKGTAVWARVCPPGRKEDPKPFEVGAVSVALEREEVCGDAWELDCSGERLRLMIADGLGHGRFAEEAAREAISVFRAHPGEPLGALLGLMHQALGKTRGAAVAVAEVLLREEKMRGAGVGNIATRVVHHTGSKNLVSDNGTLGASFRRVLEFSYPWEPDALLVMHSDGVSSQWNLNDYPGLANRHPSLIAGVLYRDFKRTRDDSTVVVARCTS